MNQSGGVSHNQLPHDTGKGTEIAPSGRIIGVTHEEVSCQLIEENKRVNTPAIRNRTKASSHLHWLEVVRFGEID